MTDKGSGTGTGPTGGPTAEEVAVWMDALLDVDAIADYPNALNGLQVEGRRRVRRVGAATDACIATIDQAVDHECDLLLVHHGLFWGGLTPVTGPYYERLRRLIKAGIGLYSAHLPLDLHPEIGNNALLATELGLEATESFGSWSGNEGIGLVGSISSSRSELIARVEAVCGPRPSLIAGGPGSVARLAVVTGGGGSLLQAAADAEADTFLTGEGNHHTYHEAHELGINVIFAGHYATETFGVKALAARVGARFGLEHTFFDVPTGM